MNKTYALILLLSFGAPLGAEQGAPELPRLDAAAVREKLDDRTTVKAATAWEAYDTNNFPNGSQIWSISECARAYTSTPYLGCYATPEITITKKENGKPAVNLKGIIVSKIVANGSGNDSGGYGYCLKDKHRYQIMHEVRVMEKGRPVAYLYPEFYASAFKPGTSQNLYEWGGAYFGTANCDKTDKSLVFTGENSYTVASPAAALDFGNIGFLLNVKQLTFVKL